MWTPTAATIPRIFSCAGSMGLIGSLRVSASQGRCKSPCNIYQYLSTCQYVVYTMRWPIWPTIGEKCSAVVQQRGPLETLMPCSPNETHTAVKRHVNCKPIENANLWNTISIWSHCQKHIWSKFMTSRNLEHIVDLYMGASVTLQWLKGGQCRFQVRQLWKRLNHYQISHYSACAHHDLEPLPHTTLEAVRSRSKPGRIHPRSLVS